MVAPLGLGDALLVGLELLLGGPRRAVDALQHRVLLAAAPVGGGRAGQGEAVADQLGGGQVRAAAQVGPGDLAAAANVVVHREPAVADLDARALGRLAGIRLQADELELVGLGGLLGAGVVIADLPAHEGLALADDPPHLLLEGLEVLGGERLGDVEVVVEAVGDGRADAQLGLGVDALDRLREDVGRAVAEDRETVGAGDLDRLDRLPVGEGGREVPQLAVDAEGDHLLAPLEEVGAGRPLLEGSGTSVEGDGELGHWGLLGR